MEKIIGKTVYLRPITDEDTNLIINWRNSDAVRPYFIYQKPFKKEGQEKFGHVCKDGPVFDSKEVIW